MSGMLLLLLRRLLLLLPLLLHSACAGDRQDAAQALSIPLTSGELTTPDELHQALAPAWRSLVEERNAAGLVGPKDEGKAQPPLSKEEAAFQYDRVQRGEVDSARLLLVFGMVPSARYLDNQMHAEAAGETTGEGKERGAGNLPALLDPNQRYPDGSTPLHMAATFGLVKSLQGFLDAGADIAAASLQGLQPIHTAAIVGQVAVLDVLTERRADVGARHAFAGSTPLHFAAEMGHAGLVRRLCELRADVEAQKRQGGAALHIAADTNNSAVARALLAEPCNADPDAVLLGDTVPLYLAAGRGFPDVIDALLDAGANPDRTLWPERPLKQRKRGGQAAGSVAATLSKALQSPGSREALIPGSSPDAPGWEEGNGATALHNACENGHLQAVDALLDGGARQLATMEGVTPLITALQYRQRKIARHLLDHATPANVGVKNPRDGQTALHVAAAYGYAEVLARILRDGGPAGELDARGQTAANYAHGISQLLLVRFEGRQPKLDAVVRIHRSEADLADRLRAVRGVPTDAQSIYVDYASRLTAGDGTLEAEAGELARKLKSKGGGDESVRRRFAIARFLLAGGSDAPIAVEAMMRHTAESVHAGLVLLGVPVRELELEPKKALKVNGHDVFDLVSQAMQAAVESAQRGDADDFERLVEELQDVTSGSRRRHSAAATTANATADEDDIWAVDPDDEEGEEEEEDQTEL